MLLDLMWRLITRAITIFLLRRKTQRKGKFWLEQDCAFKLCFKVDINSMPRLVYNAVIADAST